MILKSLIKDEEILTLDCAKTRVSKGDTIEIPDCCWNENEVQGAINLGMVELVGEPPILPMTGRKKEEPRRLKFRNISESKIAFECITGEDEEGKDEKWIDYAGPGELILIPETAVNDQQVQNALAWGLLKDEEKTADPVEEEHKEDFQRNVPVVIEEVTADDLVDDGDDVVGPKKITPKGADNFSTKKAKKQKPKAKEEAKTESKEDKELDVIHEEIENHEDDFLDSFLPMFTGGNGGATPLSSEEF